VTAVGVTWGYGRREELEAARADHLVDTVGDLRALLLDETRA
jgi:phosphoglycolate phosphatase-like HAD superfamily hydrolase